ncbi:DMT family transporter [Aquimarina sp. SS2-1]|uniref:DMT family transporter n=1 Tax=Aquimarina besae TaxID=3342247 RepID=UPI003670795C
MQKSKPIFLGILLAVIGVILFSAKAVMVKMAYKYDISSEHLLLFRMSFSVPFYVVIAGLSKPTNTSKIRKTDYLWIVFFGFIGYYLASYFDFLGLQYIKAGLERIILFVYPTLVLIISRIFLKNKITKQQLAAIFITYIGVVITFWQELLADNSNIVLGVFLIFLSALTYAIYLVGSGWLIPKFGAVTFTSYAMIVSSLCIVFQYLIFDRGNLVSYHSEVYILSILMAFFATIIPSYLISYAIERIGASHVAIIGSLGPVSTIILAFFLLNESISGLQIIGSVVVIFGIYKISRNNKKR